MISPHSLIIVDTETTGPDPLTHEILSVALVSLTSGTSFEGFAKLPDKTQWTNYGRENFGRSIDDWGNRAIPAKDLVLQIEDFVSRTCNGNQAILIGHNVAFDRFFLAKLAYRADVVEINGISHRTIDTHTLLAALNMQGKLPDHALSSEGAFKYFGVHVPTEHRHTALGDAKATRELFQKIMSEFGVHTFDS